MEADLVAHCGTQIDGSYLYTLTLTDIATVDGDASPLESEPGERHGSLTAGATVAALSPVGSGY